MIRMTVAAVIVVASSLFVACSGAALGLDDAPALTVGADATGTATQTGFVQPVAGATVTQAYGCTTLTIEPADRTCTSGHRHTGIDLGAPEGTPVHATLDGITQVLMQSTGFGLHVVIDHGNGLTSLYGHLATATVHDGDLVAAGDVIGTVGSTGNSTGPHLHFEIRRDGIPENPVLDLPLP